MPLTVPSGTSDRSAVSHRVQEPAQVPRHVLDKSHLKSAAESSLRGVRESANAFPPLKSVAGHLCFILDNCEV